MSDFAGVMVKFSGGKAAATLLLAAAILAPPTTMGYMDFEVNELKFRKNLFALFLFYGMSRIVGCKHKLIKSS